MVMVVTCTVSSLTFNKASTVSPNSKPSTVLILLKNEISKQLVDLFKLSFMTGVFPRATQKQVVPIFKKDSKLD